jgi:hypothetical protein
MRRIIVILLSLVIFSSAGCRGVDVLFGLFGSNHYTGGGCTTDEKKAHFESEQEKWAGNQQIQ